MISTTFEKCRKAGACPNGYKKMRMAPGGRLRYGRHMNIPVLRIFEVLGLEDTLWVLKYACGEEGTILLRRWETDCGITKGAFTEDDKHRAFARINRRIERMKVYLEADDPRTVKPISI